MNENLIAINVPNGVSIMVIWLVGVVVIGILRKLFLGQRQGPAVGTTGAVANASAS